MRPSVDNVERALTPATRLVFVETIANPRTQVADLARIGALCRERGMLYVVDNTMTSPWLFRPKTVDAGLIVNALTKYIGGHGNALGGAVTDTGHFDWTQFPNIADSYKTQKPALWGITQMRKKGLRDWGGTLAAEQAHHIAVGAETLALRMERQCANAQALAEYLVAPPEGQRGPLSRACPRIRSTSSRRRCSARPARCCRSSSSRGLDVVAIPQSAARRRAVVESRRQPDARHSGRADDLLGNGRGAAGGDGHRRFAHPRVGRASRTATT